MDSAEPPSKGQAWFCTTGLPSDVVVEVGDMTFHLHKFPLMAKSKKLHDLITEEDDDEDGAGGDGGGGGGSGRISLPGFPGGAAAFEAAAKFCYGVRVELTASTAAPLRCAAEYLGMTDDASDDNLAGRVDRFLAHAVARSPRDAVRALKSCESLLPLADELGLVERCVEAIASKAVSTAAGDAWVDDLAGLSLETYTRVIAAMKARGARPELVEGALIAYVKRAIPGIARSSRHSASIAAAAVAAPPEAEQRRLLEAVVAGLPDDVPASPLSPATARVLFGLLRTANILRVSDAARTALERRAAARLESATVDDLLIPSYSYLVETLYDVECVERIVGYFVESQEEASGSIVPAAAAEDAGLSVVGDGGNRTMLAVGRLMDAYLAEVATDVNLKPDKFCDLALALPDRARVFDDGIYRAIDIYLKAHPGLREEEKEKVSGVMDGRKLTLEACTHAAQNERLPLRTVVQVLFFEQLQLRRAITTTIMATAGGDGGDERRAFSGERRDQVTVAGSGGAVSWSTAAQNNQMLRLDMDSMRSRVSELERDCSTMRKAIEKLDRRRGSVGGGGKAAGSAADTGEGRWGSMVVRRLGCRFPTQVCDSQQRAVVGPPQPPPPVTAARRPRIEQSP